MIISIRKAKNKVLNAKKHHIIFYYYVNFDLNIFFKL